MEYPRCSTALDGSLEENSLDDDVLHFGTSVENCENNANLSNVDSNGTQRKLKQATVLLKLKEVIESLKLDSCSPPQESDSDYTSLTTSSDASLRFDFDVIQRPSDIVELEASVDELSDDTLFEPEADVIDQFRQFGLRFIRKPSQYSFCKCEVPQELLQYHYNLSEVACEADAKAVSRCLQMRWAEVKQNFDVDVFGDLQFQDFLLGRQQRGPYHAMIHFGNVFANVGYDGTYWYWILMESNGTPFVEDKFRNKDNFVNSLRTMVRHQLNTQKVLEVFVQRNRTPKCWKEDY